MTERARVILVTGWPGFIGRRLVRGIARELDPALDRIVLFTRAPHVEAARGELRALGLAGEVAEGDVTRMHLGLSGPEYKGLAAQVTEIWHLAGRYDLGANAA